MEMDRNGKPLESPAPLLAKLHICTLRGFCRKLNFVQLSFEAFFDITGTLGSAQSYSEPNFPFQHVI